MIIGLDIDDVIYQTGEMVKRLLTDFDDLDATTKMCDAVLHYVEQRIADGEPAMVKGKV